MTNPTWPRVARDAVPWITTADMIDVDRVMIDDLGIGLIQMMENAGRNLAELVIGLHGPRSAAVYVGSGGNGGGGLVAARHLHNRGVATTVVTGRPREALGEVPGIQLAIAERIGISVVTEPVDAELFVDALIGYSLRGAPRGRLAELIVALEERSTGAPIVSLDVPSGVDTTTGATPGVAVNASATLTLALPKIGLRASPNVGRLFVGDISVPPSVHGDLEPDVRALFGESPIVEIASARG